MLYVVWRIKHTFRWGGSRCFHSFVKVLVRMVGWEAGTFSMLTFKILAARQLVMSSFDQRWNLTEMKSVVESSHKNNCLICVPYTKTAKYGDRCFMKAAANLWNPLPVFLKFSVSVSSLKRNLKTYLFKRAYDKWFHFYGF